jgi:uncharacterized protein (TIGR02271 family)
MSRHEDHELVRHEEELDVEFEEEPIARVRARKRIESRDVQENVERRVEDAEVSRAPAAEGDSGEIETLPDGSVSIPLFEEELVVTKRLVVRERLVIHKRTHVETERIEETLRSERIDVEERGPSG